MDEELRSHIQHRADDLERSGVDRAEAERRARIEFGGRQRFQRRMPRSALAATSSRPSCGICATACACCASLPVSPSSLCLTLALGDRRQRRGLRYFERADPAPAECASGGEPLRRSSAQNGWALPVVSRLCRSARSQPEFRWPGRLYNIAQVGIDTGKNPSRAWVYEVSGNYFDVLGMQPYLGRFFHASDEHGPEQRSLCRAHLRVLAHPFSGRPRRRWPSRPAEQASFTILGVAPPEFHGTLLFFSPDFFVPLVNQEQVEGHSNLNARGDRAVFQVMGHLKPGVTPAQAAADLNSIGFWLEKAYPKEDGQVNFSLGRQALQATFLPVRRGRSSRH